MKITLKKLVINNFKGIKHLVIDFGAMTNIFGANEAGKTSVFDAFLWLLFGKDSTDREKFSIKNTKDTALNRQDHEVCAVLEIGDRQTEVKKIFREKWTKKRGASKEEYTGNENVYFWNDVPCTQAEYQAKIKDLIDEKAFKLLTNTLYFNTVVSWQERRAVLLKLAGNITDDQVFSKIVTPANKGQFIGLINLLNQGKTLEEIKKQYSGKKKQLKDELDTIPTRIDEVLRGIPQQQDWKRLDTSVNSLATQLAGIDESMLNASKALQSKQTAQRELQQQIYELQRKSDSIVHQLRSDIEASDRNSRQELDSVSKELADLIKRREARKKDVQDVEFSIREVEGRKVILAGKWREANSEEISFPDGAFCCPTCKRELEVEDVEKKRSQLEANFNREKAEKIARIDQQGKQLKKELEQHNDRLQAINAELLEMETAISDKQSVHTSLQTHYTQPRPVEERLAEAKANNKEYQHLQSAIASLKDRQEEVPQVDNTELLARKREVTDELDQVKRLLATKEQIETGNMRVKQLQDQEQKLAQELADLEATEYAAEQFTKAKMDLMVSRINGMFRYVEFKLFDYTIEGGSIPVCETMYNGVPFSDLNTAAKALVGIDIINALSAFYKVQAPIFIDNRESITWIPDTDSQIINLIVSPKDKQLRVVAEGVEATLFA